MSRLFPISSTAPNSWPGCRFMLFDNVVIKSVAVVDAPNRVTSVETCERLAPTFERLRFRGNPLIDVAGIEERRFWDHGMLPSDAATLAAKKVLERADIDPRSEERRVGKECRARMTKNLKI